MEISNMDRAIWAAYAVSAFKQECATDDCDVVADLICNLLHLCDVNPEKYGNAADMLRRGAACYEQEKQDEKEMRDEI